MRDAEGGDIRRVARHVAVVALIAVLGVGGVASAASQPAAAKLVLFILDRPADPVAERLRANIEGLGLKVVTMEGWRDPERAELMEEVAREQQAVASIRILPTRRGVELWMADETSGRALVRQLIVDNSPGGPDENAIAMQLLEVLRTGLLVEPEKVEPLPPPPPPVIERPPSAFRPECASVLGCPRIQVGVGPLTASGGLGLALQGWFSVQTTLGRRAALALDGAVPILTPSASGPEGSASVSASMLGLTALMRLEDQDSRLSATAGAGLFLLRVASEGTAVAPLVAKSSAAFTGAGVARVDAACDLTHWLRLTLRVMAGVAVQRIDLDLAGNDAASWGRFFAAAMLMLDAGRR